jgi:hypothetical protein
MLARPLIPHDFIGACALYRKSLWEKVGGYDEHMPSMAWGNWVFLPASCCPWQRVFHIPKIRFEYRVPRDPLAVMRTSSHLAELANYISGKPEMAGYKLLRETDEAIFNAREVLVESGFRPAWKQILRPLHLSRSSRVIWKICSFFVLWFRIIASRFKRRIRSKFNAFGQS